jgi:chromosome segregation ATPase
MALEFQSGELEDTNAKYREVDKELRSLCTEVKNLNKELRRKGNDLTTLRTKVTQLETTWKKKLAKVEGREDKLKGEAKENESRMARFVEAGKINNLELRNTINRLVNDLETLQQEAAQQKQRAARREFKWEIQLNQAKKDHAKADSERETLEDTLEELNEERRERIEVRESGRRGNPVND